MSNSLIQSPCLDEDDPSLSRVNQAFLRSWRSSRPRDFSEDYSRLSEQVCDPYICEMLWLLYGSGSAGVLDRLLEVPGFKRPWWRFQPTKMKVSSLIMTKSGKMRVWEMLHNDSAWV